MKYKYGVWGCGYKASHVRYGVWLYELHSMTFVDLNVQQCLNEWTHCSRVPFGFAPEHSLQRLSAQQSFHYLHQALSTRRDAQQGDKGGKHAGDHWQKNVESHKWAAVGVLLPLLCGPKEQRVSFPWKTVKGGYWPVWRSLVSDTAGQPQRAAPR